MSTTSGDARDRDGVAQLVPSSTFEASTVMPQRDRAS